VSWGSLRREIRFVSGDNPSPVVSIIDTATNLIVGNITVGAGASHMALTPDDGRLYLAHENNVASVIDTVAQRVLATFPVAPAGLGSRRVAIRPDGKRAYFTIPNTSPGLAVLDIDAGSPTYHTVVANVPIPAGQGVAIMRDGRRAYVAHCSNMVSVVDIQANQATGTVTLPTAAGCEVATQP